MILIHGTGAVIAVAGLSSIMWSGVESRPAVVESSATSVRVKMAELRARKSPVK